MRPRFAIAMTTALTACGGSGSSAPTAPPPPSVTTTSLPDATWGAYYILSLRAEGGTGTYTWNVDHGGTPAGIALDGFGTLSGWPTAVGVDTFGVRVTSGGRDASRDLILTVVPVGPKLTISTASLPDGVLGQSYSQNLSAAGGSGSYVWGVAAGALPTGLSIVYSSTGYIGGTPSAAGTDTFTVRVSSGGWSATKHLSITTLAQLQITTSSLPNGTVGALYSDTLRASGGTGQYAWSLYAGLLPAGLTFSASGVLGGTPTAAGSSTFIVQVTSGTQSKTGVMSLIVS